MTAEVVAMNRLAVAIAADSAVTIRLPRGEKIYQSANKLFPLTKESSVGVMFYGSAEFMEMPWESILKIFREDLGDTKFAKLDGYSDTFLRFLRTNRVLFPASAQRRYVRNEAISFLYSYGTSLRDGLRDRLAGKTNISESTVKRTLTYIIKSRLAEIRTLNSPASLPSSFPKTILTKYSTQLTEAIDETYRELPLSQNARRYLRQLISEVLYRTFFIREKLSGVVFAGFGEKEVFPRVLEFHVRGIANNRLWYLPGRASAVDRGNEAVIIAFAQSEMVSTFMEGIDPRYDEFMKASLKRLFDGYVAKIVSIIPNLSDTERKRFRKDLRDATDEQTKQLNQGLNEYRIEKHVDPVVSMISALPKDELARVAEALVNLTSFKRRISAELETVAEPIDVAVISKGDGFVWTKRKAYFPSKLNPQE